MDVCAACGREVQIDKYFTVKDTCQHCGRDLRSCVNCRFYSESSHNKCLESQADFQRTRQRANHCDYFKFSAGAGTGSAGGDEAADARSKFDDLFK